MWEALITTGRLGPQRYQRPHKISGACALFLAKKWTIFCKVTNTHCFSKDLPQEGLKIPCKKMFRGKLRDVVKVKKLVSSSQWQEQWNQLKKKMNPRTRKENRLGNVNDAEKICYPNSMPSVRLKFKGICLTKKGWWHTNIRSRVHWYVHKIHTGSLQSVVSPYFWSANSV